MAYIGNSPYQGNITGGNVVDGSIEAVDLGTLSYLNVSGDLTVDTNTFYVDSTNNGVGIGTTSVDLVGNYSSLILQGKSTTEGGLMRFYNSDRTTMGQIYNTDTAFNVVAESGLPLQLISDGGSGAFVHLDINGNVGIGGAPSDFGSAYRALEIGEGNAFMTGATGISQTFFASNAYYNGTNWIYKHNGYARNYIVDSPNGQFSWDAAVSGTAGGTVSWVNQMKLDANGNLLVGTGSASTPWPLGASSPSIKAVTAQSNGQLAATHDQGNALVLNRTTNDGSIAAFYKDGTAVGSIGTYTGATYLAFNPTKGITSNATHDIVPCTSTGVPQSGGYMQLGNGSYPFSNLFLSGGVYLGGTGAANYLDDYEEGTWTPTVSGFSAVTYNDQVGSYIKIGNVVILQFAISFLSVTGSASGLVVINPFTCTSITSLWGQGSVLVDNLSSITPLSIQVTPGSVNLTVIDGNGGTGTHIALPTNKLSNASVVRGTMCFRVD